MKEKVLFALFPSFTKHFFPQVSWHVKKAYDLDFKSLTLKAMPGITKCHVEPTSFEQQRVSYAFQLFGERVLQGLHLYKDEIEAKTGPINGTQEFFK